VIAPNQPTSGAKGSVADQNSASAAPAINLPKGGGAIRGMGEKFAANPVTGTGSITVPIATSPGRSGFGPQLALSYDSGAGNGPYGFGWNLSLPSITRKTDKGLPRYEDADESDVFILSGAEDLVPVFKTDPITGEFVTDAEGNFVYDESPRDGYLVRRYRPRIEGLFVRIERWTRQSDGDVHWRSISKDNITTFYGKTEESRIAAMHGPGFDLVNLHAGMAFFYRQPELDVRLDLHQHP
jgi:virulence plasmid B protein